MCGSEKKTAGCISKNKGRNITAVAKVSHASVELHAWPFLVLYVVCCFWFRNSVSHHFDRNFYYVNKMEVFSHKDHDLIQNHIKK